MARWTARELLGYGRGFNYLPAHSKKVRLGDIGRREAWLFSEAVHRWGTMGRLYNHGKYGEAVQPWGAMRRQYNHPDPWGGSTIMGNEGDTERSMELSRCAHEHGVFRRRCSNGRQGLVHWGPGIAAFFVFAFVFFPLPEKFPSLYWLFHSLWHLCVAAAFYELYMCLEGEVHRPPALLTRFRLSPRDI
jgi:hypothetical protein